jgi:hypothetical protein
MEAIETDLAARSRFLRGCHRGHDRAQQRIGSLVIELQRQVAASEAELMPLRHEKNTRRADVEARLIVLCNRQLALRRLAVALLCVITRLESWILRRLVLDRRIRGIEPTVLRKTLDVATRRNSDSRLRFSLVSDLTTVVQIGDLVEISFDPADPKWRLVELKQGRINELLSGLVGKELSTGDAKSLDDEIAATLGEHAGRQGRRMRRQMIRLREVEKIIKTARPSAQHAPRNDSGPRHHRKLRGGDSPSSRRVACYGSRRSEHPRRVHLVGLRRDQVRGDYIGAVGHVFLHLRHLERECRLVAGTDEGMAEFREIQQGPIFVDLVANSMHAQWGMPVYLWVEPEKTVDLVVGEIRVFAQFDMEEFFAFAARDGIKITWVTGKHAERLKKEKVSQRIPGSPNAWGMPPPCSLPAAPLPPSCCKLAFSPLVFSVMHPPTGLDGTYVCPREGGMFTLTSTSP